MHALRISAQSRRLTVRAPLLAALLASLAPVAWSAAPALLLLASCQTLTASLGHDSAPSPSLDVTLSTNWTAAARAALPASAMVERDLPFQQLTNALRAESQRGNTAAKGLWGFVLLVRGHSQDETNAGLHLLLSSADEGYVPAMMNLGLLFEGGQYVSRDYDQAFHWFSLAASKGAPEAQLQLGGCYHYGLGTTQDFSLAAKWYRLSASQTNYVAMKSLGYLLMNGLGVDKDLDAATFWLTRAAKEGGNRRAMYNLGALCSRKFPDTNSMAEAFNWYKKSAELDDPLACFQLSNFYFRGWGAVETNLANYRYWLSRAAVLGATDAQYFMGAAYRTGDGVPQDVENSLKWFRLAAAKNHPKAFYDLALHYLEDRTNQASATLARDYMSRAALAGHREAQFQVAMASFRGDPGSPDFEAGKQWLAKAASNGWARAEFCLFQLYYNGLPPGPNCPSYPKAPAEGVKWLRRAADHGHLQAQGILAVMLIRGRDMDRNKAEAEKLLRNAAEHGDAQAQNDLGFAIQDGDTGKVDFVEAAKWCRLPESGTTNPDQLRRFKVNLASALSRLTADQQLEVDRQVQTFQALPPPDIDPMIQHWEDAPPYQQEDGRFGH